jgi:four helix bundle protein
MTNGDGAKGHRQLDAYERAFALLRPVHELVGRFPDYEKFDLANQIRRAAKSVPANIAEGYARRRSAREFVRFIELAIGSANELEVHFDIARELGYITDAEDRRFSEAYQTIGKQLNRSAHYWRSTTQRPATSDQPPATSGQETAR